MGRIVVPALLDPTNTGASIAASPSRFINTLTESVAPGHGKAPVWRERTPGIHVFGTLDDHPVRGLFEVNDRAFVVSGSTFYELFVDGTWHNRGAVANDLQPVSFATNGRAGQQIMLTSGGFGYIYSLTGNTLVQITDANFPYPARCCEYLDGYFLALQGSGSSRFQWSALNDGLVWPPLQFANRSRASDNLTSMIRTHTDLLLVGFRTSEVWQNTGDINNTFAPIPGVFIEHGGQGIFTPQRLDNTVYWMGLGDDGQGVVWRLNGYIPERVSTFAIETVLQRAETPTDARAFAFQMRGHLYYNLLLPRSTETMLVYDVTMGRWHEWAHWNSQTVSWVPHVAGSHVFVFNRHLVGDRVYGIVYELSQDFYDDELVLGVPA